MIVALEEFKANFDKYEHLIGKEEIVITRDGAHFASITPIPHSKDEKECNGGIGADKR